MTRYFRRDGPTNRKVEQGHVYKVSKVVGKDTYVLTNSGNYAVSPERWTEVDVDGNQVDTCYYVLRVAGSNARVKQGRVYKMSDQTKKIADDQGCSMKPKLDDRFWVFSNEEAFLAQQEISEHHPLIPTESVQGTAPCTRVDQHQKPAILTWLPSEYKQSENTMLKIENVIQINGCNVSNFEDAELIKMIKSEKERAAELSALDIKSKKVSSMLIKCNANIDHLIEILDASDD